ncbi:hypothetical protein [Burkholderia sp. WSM2230]|uniref:hypothetical protein n=1 Tax=Burkholderia sp. WSM2230 TaxID=944435 RepID=UPI000A030518|nr:hypothetical protein [Burkholderia sp. WSM2230]
MRKRCLASFIGACGVLLAAMVCWIAYRFANPADEVMLMLGEPYEQVRKHSRSTLPPVQAGISWMGALTRPGRLRFSDPQYGFTTPPSRFFSVRYDEEGKVEGVILSPQTEALPLDESLAIVMNLQDQLRRAGWTAFQASRWRPMADTAEFRRSIRNCDDPTSYWNGGAAYQIGLDIRCFRPEAENKERFLVTLDLTPTWMNDRPGE